ncbi:MAG: inorganic phosphate transporter [Candidatus Heimdallarchaeaceae archaeon]
MDPVIIVLLILMLVLSFGIGANDETMATLVGSRSIKTKYAIILGAVLAFVGVIFLSEQVGKTIGENLLGYRVVYNHYMLFAIIISTTIWLIVASTTGAPISTTHSVVGSVFGVAIIWSIQQKALVLPTHSVISTVFGVTSTWGFQAESAFLASLNWGKLGEVALGWVLSPLLGLIGALLLKLLVNKIISKFQKGLDRLEKMERVSSLLLIGIISWTQVSRGGNDSANALGILYGLIESGGNDSVVLDQYKIWLVIGVGIMLSLGILIIGRKVIKNVGNNLLDMKPSDGLSIELSTSIVLFVATILGLPVSGTHVLVFAIIGAGFVKGEKPEGKSFRKMLTSWLITFPVAAVLSAVLYGSLYGIFII